MVDKRADIWAFGVVLYEMVTGRRLFEGEDVTETLALVIKGEPKWEGIPANVQRLLKSCLQKDPKRRLRDIGDAWHLLEEAPARNRYFQVAARNRWRWIVAALAVAVACSIGLRALPREAAAAEVVRFQISPPAQTSFTRAPRFVARRPPRGLRSGRGADGRNQLWVRSLDSLESRAIGRNGRRLQYQLLVAGQPIPRICHRKAS